MTDTPTTDLRLALLLIVTAFAGCSSPPELTNQQKFEMAKQCIDAGMWPDVYADKVTCNAVGKLK